MEKPAKASFSFIKFKVKDFVFFEVQEIDGLSLGLSPQGRYSKKNGLFSIDCTFELFNQKDETDDKLIILSGSFLAEFSFNDKPSYNEIQPFFFTNSLAIAFPYLRAFVSSVTSQTNTRHIMLPLLNLTNLVEDFKRSSIEEE